jgi:hypothetical protein
MHRPENGWRFAGLILNFAGAMLLLWHSNRVMRITPNYGIAIAVGVSLWPWYLGLGLNILGFAFQLFSNVYGGERRAPPSVKNAVPSIPKVEQPPDGTTGSPLPDP